jgi:hypothetical protein
VRLSQQLESRHFFRRVISQIEQPRYGCGAPYPWFRSRLRVAEHSCGNAGLAELTCEGRAAEAGCLRRSQDERAQDEILAGVVGHQCHFMHPPQLPDSIDAAAPLLQAERCPGELEVHDQATDVVQVEPFRRGVRCHEDASC